SDHVRAIIKHTGPGIIDYCVANVSRIPKQLYEKYKLENKYPVEISERDESWFKEEKIKLVKANIAGIKEFVRHDPMKLSDVIMDILSQEKRK
ncbi:MAG: 2-phospho-L-lactate transferase CofD family protein, partial [Candidatus Omnitrophota bacterium]